MMNHDDLVSHLMKVDLMMMMEYSVSNQMHVDQCYGYGARDPRSVDLLRYFDGHDWIYAISVFCDRHPRDENAENVRRSDFPKKRLVQLNQ